MTCVVAKSVAAQLKELFPTARAVEHFGGSIGLLFKYEPGWLVEIDLNKEVKKMFTFEQAEEYANLYGITLRNPRQEK